MYYTNYTNDTQGPVQHVYFKGRDPAISVQNGFMARMHQDTVPPSLVHPPSRTCAWLCVVHPQ